MTLSVGPDLKRPEYWWGGPCADSDLWGQNYWAPRALAGLALGSAFPLCSFPLTETLVLSHALFSSSQVDNRPIVPYNQGVRLELPSQKAKQAHGAMVTCRCALESWKRDSAYHIPWCPGQSKTSISGQRYSAVHCPWRKKRNFSLFEWMNDCSQEQGESSVVASGPPSIDVLLLEGVIL